MTLRTTPVELKKPTIDVKTLLGPDRWKMVEAMCGDEMGRMTPGETPAQSARRRFMFRERWLHGGSVTAEAAEAAAAEAAAEAEASSQR